MEIEKAFRIVIDYIDEEMGKAPSRELAETSNQLEDILAGIKRELDDFNGRKK